VPLPRFMDSTSLRSKKISRLPRPSGQASPPFGRFFGGQSSRTPG
jgi:hypothetical protein